MKWYATVLDARPSRPHARTIVKSAINAFSKWIITAHVLVFLILGVNNCVGHQNHKVFMIFLVSASSMLIYASLWFAVQCWTLFSNMVSISNNKPARRGRKGPSRPEIEPFHLFQLFMCFVNCILALAVGCHFLTEGIAIGALLFDQVQQVWYGVTGIEWYTRKTRIKAARKDNKPYKWPYDCGTGWANVRFVMGDSVWQWLSAQPPPPEDGLFLEALKKRKSH